MFPSQDHTRLTMTQSAAIAAAGHRRCFLIILLAQLWLLRKIEAVWKITPKSSSRFSRRWFAQSRLPQISPRARRAARIALWM